MYVDTSHIVKPKPVVTQQEEAPTFTSSEYTLAGKLYCMKNPKSAKELLEEFYTVKAKAKDEDYHNLNFYYLHFCRINQEDPLSYLGEVNRRDKVQERKVFIAAMLRIYKPQSFSHDINIAPGLNENLCMILRYDKGAMSRIIDEVVVWYNHDVEGFRGIVDELVVSLVGVRDGYSSDLFNNRA
jgi:hypothetical protein